MKKEYGYLVVGMVVGVLIGALATNALRSKPAAIQAGGAATTAKPMEKIVGTHAVGLCNRCMFSNQAKQFSRQFGVEIELKDMPNWADHPAALKSGQVDVSVTPFSNVITAYENGMPIKVIAGSGINGLFLIGQKGIDTAEKLRGKKIGTFRADTLEIAAYDFLRKAGLKSGDYEMVYFTSSPELITAFASKAIDAMTHVEPYATQACTKYGGVVISRGQDVWGDPHPDCVLVTSEKVLADRREALKGVICGMLRGEALIEQNFAEATDICVPKYYSAAKEDILAAGKSQPPGVDIRDKVQFMIDRSKSLLELGYISKPVDKELFDFSLLEEVIREHPDLWQAVKVKAKMSHE